MGESVPIVRIEDEAALADALRSVIAQQDGPFVIGVANTPVEALELARELKPAVVLLRSWATHVTLPAATTGIPARTPRMVGRDWQSLSARPYGNEVMGTLTHRELDVLRLILEGRSNRVIAIRLRISLTTVRGHVQNILAKLGVYSKLAAMATAIQYDVLSSGAANALRKTVQM